MEVFLQYIYYVPLREFFVPEYLFIYRLHHILMMDFYRKLFYKCYWRDITTIESGSRWKKVSIIGFSILASIFISFFYDPSDPTNSKSASSLLNVSNYIKKFLITISNLNDNFVNSFNKILNGILNHSYILFLVPAHQNLAYIRRWRI
ncbi:MAG TPA: hypothetical protein VHP32_09390 [Ignavibacteria bacterium]|nr:hypothetical protein [Ignavibacteria bacterium]